MPCNAAVPAPPLRQAVLNLLLNACAAIPVGGRLGVSCCYDGGLLHISVMDSGPGLPGPAIDTLCAKDPPSPIESGSGLGLWMVRRLVIEVGGSITVTESPLGGASINISVATAQCEYSTGDPARACA